MFCSRRVIESLGNSLKGIPHAFISIKTPSDDTNPMIPICPGSTLDILRLAFDDVDPKQYPEGFQFRSGVTPFNDTMASEVWDFIDNLPDDCTVYVHCDAGLSRSPGLAAGLSKILNNDDAGYFENAYPNMLVYRTIINHRQR